MTDEESSSHSLAMLVCCAMKIGLIGFLVIGGGAGGIGAISGTAVVFVVGLAILLIAAACLAYHCRTQACDTATSPDEDGPIHGHAGGSQHD